MIIGKQPIGKNYRVSSNAVWPLRRANGLTWAESKDAEARIPNQSSSAKGVA